MLANYYVAPELISRIFDSLELHELLRLALVSRHWRRTVLAHRTYWGSHVLRSGDEDRVQFFLDRLDRSEGRPVTIRIIVPSPSLLPARVFPALNNHLAHTVLLTLALSCIHISDAFTALLSPAPVLEQFNLEFSSDAFAPTLPGGIFLGVAPTLRLCTLRHVQLPEPVPPVFSAVETLEYGLFKRAQIFAQRTVSAAFPKIHTLMLRGRFSWESSSPIWPSQWISIDALILSLSRSTLKTAMDCIPISRIRCILVADAPPGVIQRFMSDLLGDLDLCLQDFPDHDSAFRVVYRDRTTNLTRGFTVQSMAGFLRYTFVSSEIARRVMRLSIPVSLWRPLVRSLPSFRVLVDLELVAYGRFDPIPLIGVDTLLCPQLQTLNLRSDRDLAYVASTGLASFARDVLRGTQYPICLTLHNVVLDGDLWVLSNFFHSMERATPTEKIYPYPYWEF